MGQGFFSLLLKDAQETTLFAQPPPALFIVLEILPGDITG